MIPAVQRRPPLRSCEQPVAGAAPDCPQSVYEQHFAFVWRNLRRLGLSEQAAEDAAQDVFLVVFRRWDSYDVRWSSVKSWLFGIVYRVAADHRRSQRRRRRWIDPVSCAEDAVGRARSLVPDPAEGAQRREAAELLEALLDELDAAKRALLVMVDVEELTVPEAAEALGVNVNTAYTRLRAARAELTRAAGRRGLVNGEPGVQR